MVDTCYLKHLESLLIDLGNVNKNLVLFFSLDQTLNLELEGATALSKSHSSLSVEFKSHLVMTPVILIGNVQPCLVRFYMYM